MTTTKPPVQALYLHGFRSSPESSKARLLAQVLPAHGIGWSCPQLPVDPQLAMQLATDWVAQHSAVPAQRLVVLGSSLGGFFATWLAQTYPRIERVVLLNPAVHPWDDLKQHTGTLSNFHTGEALEVRSEHIAALQHFRVSKINLPQRYFLIAAQGDELLDWRDMVSHYPGAHVKVLQGSNHSITDFADHLDEVLAFLVS